MDRLVEIGITLKKLNINNFLQGGDFFLKTMADCADKPSGRKNAFPTEVKTVSAVIIETTTKEVPREDKFHHIPHSTSQLCSIHKGQGCPN
jgi:hypothetical protein